MNDVNMLIEFAKFCAILYGGMFVQLFLLILFITIIADDGKSKVPEKFCKEWTKPMAITFLIMFVASTITLYAINLVLT